MSRTVVVMAVDQDDTETLLGYTESHDENLCESLYVVSVDDIPEGTVCIAIRIIP